MGQKQQLTTDNIKRFQPTERVKNNCHRPDLVQEFVEEIEDDIELITNERSYVYLTQIIFVGKGLGQRCSFKEQNLPVI